MTTDLPRYVPLRKMAEILGVGESTFRAYIAQGKVNGFKTPGGQWRFDHEQIIRSRQNQSRTQTI